MRRTLIDWAPARGARRWTAVLLSLLLFLVLIRSAQNAIEAPYDGLVAKKHFLVARVSPGSPAERAGFREGDRILSYAPAHLPPAPGDTRFYTVERNGQTIELALTYSTLPTNELARKLSQSVVVLSFLAIGLIVFLQRSDKTGTLFFLTSFLFAGIFANPPPIAGSRFLFPTKVFYDLSVLLLPPVFLHFFLVFPEEKRWLAGRRRRQVAIYLPIVLLLVPSLYLDSLIARTGLITRGMLVFQDVGSVVMMAYYLLGLLSFGHSFRTQQSLAMRRRLRYVFAGTVLGAGPLVILSLILSVWPSAAIPGFRYAFLPLALIPLSFGHAIVKYRLMDLDIIVRRSVAYTLLTAALVAIYVGVVQGLGGHLLRLKGQLTLFLSVLSIFIIALVFNTLRDRIQRMVDRLFYMGGHSFPETLRDMGLVLGRPLALSEILEDFVERLADVLKIENVCVLLFDPASRSYVVGAESGLPSLAAGKTVFESSQETVRWLEEEQMPVPIERLARNARYQGLPTRDKETLERLRTALLAPVVSGSELVAILSLGSRKSQDFLSGQHLALVEAIASQTARTIEAARLRQEREARERLQHELEIARQIQTGLLPKMPPQLPGLTVSGINIPCHEVGGDYYDYIVLSNNRLGLAIADVSGKGVSAALLMATLQAAFRAEAETDHSPGEVLRKANRRVLESFGPERFASVFYCVADIGSMKLVYASAGHEPPLLLRLDGKIEALDSTGIVLGVSPDAEYQDREVPMSRGDTLLLYTDGVTEELNEDEETFGRHRLQTVLADSRGTSPEETAERILEAVHHFTVGSIQDDVTLVTLGFE